MKSKALLNTNFTGLKLYKKGKVRDIYQAGENLLMVATDRISAYDVIMDDPIPEKGIILNKISEFWFNFSSDVIENHLITTDLKEFPEEFKQYEEELTGRSMLVKKTELIPIECIVRGYISGSAWKEYLSKGSVSGIKLPEGLSESEKLSEVIFTPSTKAELGAHDENISQEKAKDIAGKNVFEKIKDAAIEIYKKASDFAESRGIIIADTKMEFGIVNGKVILIDELLTPDSSRFWLKDDYEKGRSQKSFDKQYLRDYLTSINFSMQPPAPKLPEEIISNTRVKYSEALGILTGEYL